jgi:hypothetical protein
VGGGVGDEAGLEGGGGELTVRGYLPDLRSRNQSRNEGAEMGRGGQISNQREKEQWRWRRGEGRVATNLDVVVRSGCGEAAGDGVEVEAEHRLLVVPVDLQRPAPHLVEWWWMGLRRSGVPPQRISPPPLALARWLRLQSSLSLSLSLSLSHTHTHTHTLHSLSLGFGFGGEGKRPAAGK